MSKNCPVCGNKSNDSVKFCMSCGFSFPKEEDDNATVAVNMGSNTAQAQMPQNVSAQPQWQPPQGAPVQNQWQAPQGAPVQNQWQVPQGAPAQNQWQAPQGAPAQNQWQAPQEAPKQALGMGWFKFLIYFALFAGAILNFASGINMLTGNIYGADAKEIYNFYGDGLKTLDVVVGILCIAVAGFGVFTRFRLSGFYKNAIIVLIVFYSAVTVVNLIYIIGIYAVLPDFVTRQVDVTSYSTQIGTSIGMGVANYMYFNKRKELFVN